MNKKDKIEKIRKYVEKIMDCPGHNLDHVMRVYNICLTLSKGEKINHEVLEAATLLHDIGGAREVADKAGKTDHAVESSKMAVPILKKAGFSEKDIKHIQECIITHRFKTDKKPKSIEAKLLFDADKLDGLGAIGVARTYVWIGKNNAYIYKKVDSLKKYTKQNLCGKIDGIIQDKSKHSPQIEYETKLKHITKRLNTPKAKKIAKERLDYFKKFLMRLEQEIQGKI